ncbi:ABC transporter substrate-binding protein [Streptomyces sp. NPDC056660]|uniref:ABC transporter substrate-binding protein n=1 Tax=Streptomyces sp. NPDC056660 TaxID=3345897 RepID=UPI003689D274
MKSAKPQALILILTSPEAAAFLKEAKLQGLSLPTYAYAPVAAESTIALAKDAAEGLKAVQLVKAPSDDDPAVKEFRSAMARYEPGRTAGFLALWGWSNAKVFAEIAKTVKGPVTAQSLTAADQKAARWTRGVAGHELQRGQSPGYAQRAESGGEERRLDIRRRLLHTPGTRLIDRLDRMVRPDPAGHAPGRKAGPYVDQATAAPG